LTVASYADKMAPMSGLSLVPPRNTALRLKAGPPHAPQVATPKPNSDERPARESEDRLLCVTCSSCVTRRSDAMVVEGNHQHTFVNPHGVIYRIGSFRAAGGATEIGPPSDEFAWFRGHRWRIAICSGCGIHVGWSFRRVESLFYGLVVAQLREA
jgi:hypothetical protein